VAEKDHLEVRMGVLGLPIDRDNNDYFCMKFGTHTLYHVKNTD